VSGAGADAALQALTGRLPPPRQASLARLSDPESGELLDTALVLRFPGPASATGEDLIELHLHGGRSVVAAVMAALGAMPNTREAQPGEFTRRAFENGRIDLAEAEGLADLLSSETQSQRRAALALAGGALSRSVADWQERILGVAAQVEAVLDFSDEGDVGEQQSLGSSHALRELIQDLETTLARPSAERLREGVKVVLAGPPNAGKSSLLNWLAGRQAAITSAIAGTTRDLVEAPTAIGGTPFLLVDTAGLRESQDEIEAMGVARAQETLRQADLILWLGEPHDCPDPGKSIIVSPKADLRGEASVGADVSVSAETGEGMAALVEMLIARSRTLLPQVGEVATNSRHRATLCECMAYLQEAETADDMIVAAEALRLARSSLDRITGKAGVDEMLDQLFVRFCIGK
jgi:tRNA modification GTPase